MQRELLAREKERKEKELRELAMKARMDRMGVAAPPTAAAVAPAADAGGGARVPLAARAEGRVPEGAAVDASDDERPGMAGQGEKQRRCNPAHLQGFVARAFSGALRAAPGLGLYFPCDVC